MKIQGIRWGVWGYGVVGKSVARFLHEHGAQVSIYDQNSLGQTQELPYTIYQPDQLTSFLEEQSQIVPSPGIDIKYYYATHNHKFIAELDLFYTFFKKPIIAITGSVGKTTITRIMSMFLEKAGYKIITGGNIGLGMCDFIAQQDQYDTAVLEVSSFQLEYIQCFAPHLAIITPFHPNHLDRHKTIKNYRSAKLNILKYQTESDYAVVPYVLKRFALYTSAQTSWYRQNRFNIFIDHLPQLTFKENMNIIFQAILTLGFNPFQAITILRTITLNQEHRLEHVKTIHSVEYINDSKATTPASTLAAVNFLNNKPIHLLLGGLSKGVCRKDLIKSLQNKVKRVYCFGAEADTLYAWCQEYGIPAQSTIDLSSCVADAQKKATPNEIILLSPGGSSYDLFKNYQERGDEFKKIIFKCDDIIINNNRYSKSSKQQ
jgi:UDP-N-acetylmuramoylalanine--D-glutamate ligase